MKTINPKNIEIPKLHRYLLGAIGPRPIAFASTIDKDGVANLAPFSFFNAFSANPPILVFSPARSGRTNTTKDTYNNVKILPEVVINVVNFELVHQMSLASSPYPSSVDEFVKSGLTPVASECVQPGNLIICEVLRIHIDEAILDEQQMIDQQKIDLVSRMGGNWYCRADENSMFEIPKPITTCGIGYDELPEDIKNSDVLTANNLGQLAGIESIPNETDVNEYKLIELSELFLSLEEDATQLEIEIHKRAKLLLEKNDLEEAWLTLLSFNN